MMSIIKLGVFSILLLPPILGYSQYCSSGDCFNGKGEFIFKSGAQYKGEFKNGKLNGSGTCYYSNGNTYNGEWKNNSITGKGVFIYVDGAKYNGNFYHNKKNGYGEFFYTNGDIYKGQWKVDKANGKGIFQFHSGEIYDGHFRNGKFDGTGKMSYTDGSYYIGYWKENKKNGIGSYILGSGIKKEGYWENGTYVGANNSTEVYLSSNNNVDYVYQDGSKWIGEMENGIPHGQGTCYYMDGNKYVGGWLNHTPNGNGSMYYTNGMVINGIWEDGQFKKTLKTLGEKIVQEVIKIDRSPEIKIWALVVGVADYNIQDKKLKYTDDDAYRMSAHLQSKGGGSLPSSQLRVLIDEDATRVNILKNMREIFLKADENDVILFYFSGHGVPGSFLPVDYTGSSNFLSHKEIKDIFNKSKAKHKIIYADACNSGSLKNFTPKGGDLYKELWDIDAGIAILMSSLADENSMETSELRQGVFSHYLIRGLKGEADFDHNNLVTIVELFDYVKSKVKYYTAGNQTPNLSGKFDERMPVSVLK